jgi:hypothetical protein
MAEPRLRADPAKPRIRAATGRTLAEFKPLRKAETVLLEAARCGHSAHIGDTRPSVPRQGATIRADFIRFLSLGGDAQAPVHENGIHLVGAFIEGALVIRGCKITIPLSFEHCTFANRIFARGSDMAELVFTHSLIRGYHGDISKVRGGLLFRDRSRCLGEFRLLGASVGGTLDLSGSRLYARRGVCFAGDRMTVAGTLGLTGTRCIGQLRLTNATIAGGLTCKGGVFINRGAKAFECSGLKVGGDVFWSDGFKAVGEVCCIRADFHGDLYCQGGSFRNVKKIALNCRSLNIRQAFFWRHVADLRGIVSLDSALVGDLVDEWSSWEKADHLKLNGFRYERISGGTSPTDAATRIRWLKHQKPKVFGAAFWPQPWEHAAKVLKEMGHAEDARLVAMEKQRQLRQCGVVGNRRPVLRGRPVRDRLERTRIAAINAFTRILHRLYGGLAGYGYRPLRTVGWMALVWLLAFGAFAWAGTNGLMVPKGTAGSSIPSARADAQSARFSPAIYALDMLLPLVDLKQEGDWAPAVASSDGSIPWSAGPLRALMWFEIIIGWIGSLLLVSAVGRLVQKD